VGIFFLFFLWIPSFFSFMNDRLMLAAWWQAVTM
jgi:hypothetical protein